MEANISKYNPLSYSAALYAESSQTLNGQAPAEIKQIRQAERNFVNAVLRRESGAAISPSEFASAEKQYFPQPGDDATTLAQKAKNRQTVITNLAKSAGPAMVDLSEPTTAEALAQKEKDAEVRVKQIYSQHADQIEGLIKKNPGITNADILQVLGY